METEARLSWQGERRGGDRRAGDRRAPRRPLDTLFAATLINQLAAPPETPPRTPYAGQRRVRAGIWRDLSA